MNTFGLAFVLAGALLIRQVYVGRVTETPADLRALTLAALNGDTEAMKTVLSARGENVSVESSGEVASDDSTDTPSVTPNNDFVKKVMELGNGARGYARGGTGPNYYDCSGLLWQAAKALGYYKGGRFTTSSFNSIAGDWCTKVTSPIVGDICLWPTHHMGVVVGANMIYSARSTSKGIGTSSISGDSSYFGSTPVYWRINNG